MGPGGVHWVAEGRGPSQRRRKATAALKLRENGETSEPAGGISFPLLGVVSETQSVSGALAVAAGVEHGNPARI